MFGKYSPFINAGIALFFGRLSKKPFPWYVNFFITNKCNLKCPYCYAVTNRNFDSATAVEGTSRSKDPSLDKILEIIDGLYSIGTRYICLLGGEPLLRDDLGEIIAHINAKNMLVGLNTNGTLIDRKIEVLKRLNKLTISLEGDKEKHDYDRGKGTYDKVMQNIRLLKEKKFRNFAIQMTVSTATVHSWEHILEFAREVGCTVLITEVACRPGESLESAKFDKKELKSFWLRVNELKRRGYPIENSFEAISNVLKYSDYIGPFQILKNIDTFPESLQNFTKHNICPMGKYSAFLDSNGIVYPCATLFGRRGYDTKRLSIKKAFELMSRDNTCKCCRMLLNYQLNYLFSSVNPNTLLHLGWHALRKYNY